MLILFIPSIYTIHLFLFFFRASASIHYGSRKIIPFQKSPDPDLSMTISGYRQTQVRRSNIAEPICQNTAHKEAPS